MDKKRKIFLIIGRTSSGKSTLTARVCEELGLRQVKSFTTRPMRDNEKERPEESDHYFISPAEVANYTDCMAAYTKIGNYEYFTTFDELDKSHCYVIDPLGVDKLLQRCGDRYKYVIIYISRPVAEMEKSYVSRGKQGDSFAERYEAENEEFSIFEQTESWDYLIHNDGDLETTVAEMKRIIIKEMLKLE